MKGFEKPGWWMPSSFYACLSLPLVLPEKDWIWLQTVSSLILYLALIGQKAWAGREKAFLRSQQHQVIWGKLPKNFRASGVKNELGSPWHKVFDLHTQEISHVGRNEYPTCHTRNHTANNTIPMLACQFLPLYWPGWSFGSAIVSPSTPFLLLCDRSAWNQSSHPAETAAHPVSSAHCF